MIGRLTGTFDGITRDGAVIVTVGGVGYQVRTPASAVASLSQNAPVSLYIHTAVREDSIDLYGFLTEEELAFFRQLTSVTGIGPKSALGIVNIADLASLRRAIGRGDTALLTRAYGLGKKSAERIVVELKDKIAKEGFAESGASSSDSEVLEALEALGYRQEESRKALEHVAPDMVGVRERLSAALKYLGAAAS